MADQYSNPFGMYQNVNPVPDNPIYSAFQGARNQMAAQPFMDIMQQSQQYDLAKKGMETGEFMGQEAIQQRSLGRQADMTKSRSTINTQPELDQTTILGEQEKRRAMPYATDAQIEQAKKLVMEAKAAPAREFISEIGRMYNMMSNAPEQARPQLWAQTVQRWEATHPGAKLPPQYQIYNESLMGELQAINFASVNTPEQIGRERVAGLQQDSAIVQNHETNQTRIDAAHIAAGAARDSAGIAAARPPTAESTDKQRARLRRELNSTHKNDPEKLAEYKMLVDDAWNKQVTARPALTLLEIQALTLEDPKARQQKEKEYRAVQAKFYADNGIYLNAPPAGTQRVHPTKGVIQFKGGQGLDPKDLNNWEPVKK